MEKIRGEFSYVKESGHTLAVQKEAGRVDWFNFAGGVANDVISSHLARSVGIACQANDLALSFSSASGRDQITVPTRRLGDARHRKGRQFRCSGNRSP